MSSPPERLEVLPVDGIGEVVAGTDLASLVAQLADLRDGDVVLVTSKVVSKAEGRVVAAERDAAVAGETVRVVARRGRTAIVENPLGLVMAAAGVDASNVPPGRVVLLPRDPDASARGIRERLLAATGCNAAVVVTDTAGRPWREGQTDIAVGVAGLEPVTSLAGSRDAHGNELAVTAPAVADELAGAAELAAGKLSGRPVVLVRGLAGQVMPAGEHGPGARALLRPRTADMFGLGTREAVLAAVRGTDPDAFGAPASADELLAALGDCGWPATRETRGVAVGCPEPERPLVRVVAHAHGWRALPGGDVVLVPGAAG
jgi:coenzyme F420-0:L-glutamate ligase/coenzyme F420-1:gamma-L-glutamate ligase